MIQKLQELTERSGQKLRDRGPVYPDWVLNRTDFFDPRIVDAMPRFATDEGYARRPSDQSKEEAA